MPTLFDYDSFDSFFSKNKIGSLKKFKALHDDFRSTFNRVLDIGRIRFSSEQKGTAAAFYLRAGKYLFTAHNLSLTGHTEESRAILRNVIELMIIGFLISKKDDVYKLWLECFKKKERGNIKIR